MAYNYEDDLRMNPYVRGVRRRPRLLNNAFFYTDEFGTPWMNGVPWEALMRSNGTQAPIERFNSASRSYADMANEYLQRYVYGGEEKRFTSLELQAMKLMGLSPMDLATPDGQRSLEEGMLRTREGEAKASQTSQPFTNYVTTGVTSRGTSFSPTISSNPGMTFSDALFARPGSTPATQPTAPPAPASNPPLSPEDRIAQARRDYDWRRIGQTVGSNFS